MTLDMLHSTWAPITALGAGRKLGKMRKPFQKGGKKMQPSSVMFVPNSKGGILTKRLRENEDRMSGITGFRVKYQEASS